MIQSDLAILEFKTLTEAVLKKLTTLEEQIFEKPLKREDIEQHLRSREQVLILIAMIENSPCGFKVGFQLDSDKNYFYSWIGGVAPQFRRRGIALSLMEAQHRLVKDMGFSCVRTQTKNRYREMLLLNIRCGFSITGINHKLNEKDHSIILEKSL